MSFRVIVYSLDRDKDGNTILSYKLNGEGILIDNTLESVTLRLDDKIYTIPKAVYLNKKIFDTDKTFFYLANKYVKTEYVFEKLMEYAIRKLDSRAVNIAAARQKFVRELNQHRKLIAA